VPLIFFYFFQFKKRDKTRKKMSGRFDGHGHGRADDLTVWKICSMLTAYLIWWAVVSVANLVYLLVIVAQTCVLLGAVALLFLVACPSMPLMHPDACLFAHILDWFQNSTRY
jgi:hypothetical protein